MNSTVIMKNNFLKSQKLKSPKNAIKHVLWPQIFAPLGELKIIFLKMKDNYLQIDNFLEFGKSKE